MTSLECYFFITHMHNLHYGMSIVYIEGSEVIIFQKIIAFLPLMICFVLASSADPDEMPHNVAFYLSLHCLSKYLLRGFWSSEG